MLLIRAGIESNPGPTTRPSRASDEGPRDWICCVCNKPIKNCPSVKCNKCKNWCHLRKSKSNNCSKIKNSKKQTDIFIYSTCDSKTKDCDSNPENRSPPPSPPPQPAPDPRTLPASNLDRNYNLKILKNLKMRTNDIKIAAFEETKFHKNPRYPQLHFNQE